MCVCSTLPSILCYAYATNIILSPSLESELIILLALAMTFLLRGQHRWTANLVGYRSACISMLMCALPLQIAVNLSVTRQHLNLHPTSSNSRFPILFPHLLTFQFRNVPSLSDFVAPFAQFPVSQPCAWGNVFQKFFDSIVTMWLVLASRISLHHILLHP